MKKSKSFTLIEILVVIFIIGLLATLLVINLSQARAKGRDAKRISDLESFHSAIEAFYADNHVYPWVVSACQAAASPSYLWSKECFDTVSQRLIQRGYLTKVQTDPSINPGDYTTLPKFGYRYGSGMDVEGTPWLVIRACVETSTAANGGYSPGSGSPTWHPDCGDKAYTIPIQADFQRPTSDTIQPL